MVSIAHVVMMRREAAGQAFSTRTRHYTIHQGEAGDNEPAQTRKDTIGIVGHLPRSKNHGC
jgi:hypothetical protein